MGWLASLRRLSPAERRTLILAWALLALAPLLLRVLPLRRLLTVSPCRRRPALAPERVAWLVTVAGRRVPGTRCLPMAMVTAWLLAWQGTPATLRIGVARSARDRRSRGAAADAGRPLIDTIDDGYTPIVGVPVPAR